MSLVPNRMFRRCFLLIMAWFMIADFSLGQSTKSSSKGSAPQSGDDNGWLGTNLSGLDDWSTEFSFVDAFKTSRPWFSATQNAWQDQRTVDVDERGWVRSLQPGQYARTLMYWDLSRVPGGYPKGRYVVEFEGKGTLEYGRSANRVEGTPGREVIDVDPARGGGISLTITSTDSSNPLRNIRVWLPGHEPRRGDQVGKGRVDPGIFHPSLVSRLKGYRVIRFMNWMLGQNNNNIHLKTWDERPRVEDARWSPKGAPVEVMTALCDRVGADPWFTISHEADDDSVRRFAEAVKASLGPGRKVYVEHSNEVWNGQYPQARFARSRGRELGLSTSNEFEAQIRYHARRTREIGAIFTSVLGKQRVVRVLGSWASSPIASEGALSFEGTAASVDAVAIAPYFGFFGGPDRYAPLASMSVDAALRELATVELPRVRQWIEQHAEIAKRHNVELIAYEGGQHLVGIDRFREDAAVNDLFDKLNRHPEMGRLYTRHLQDWRSAGGRLFVHYNLCGAYSRYGRFGLLEYLDQPASEAPKYQAIASLLNGAEPSADGAPSPKGSATTQTAPNSERPAPGSKSAQAKSAAPNSTGSKTGTPKSEPGKSPANAPRIPANLTDDFSSPDSLANWVLSPAEHQVRIAIESGKLVILPKTGVWYMDQQGASATKPVTGDFLVTGIVTAKSRDDVNSPPRQQFNSGGLIVLDPASAPGKRNYVLVNIGRQQNELGSGICETLNSQSRFKLDSGAATGSLRLGRIGKSLYAYRKLTGENEWRQLGEFQWPDPPQTLDVGVMANGMGNAPDALIEFDEVRFTIPKSIEDFTRD